MDVDVSIDRVSVVGRCSDTYDLQTWLYRKVNEALGPDCDGVLAPVREFPQIHGSSDGRKFVIRRWQIDGVSVSLRLRVAEATRTTIDRWCQLDDDDAAYRLEWNPNKHDATYLLLFMEQPRPTRLDVALDYDGADLGDWTLTRPRCKRVTYCDARGQSNGIQLGGMKSERFVVGYDKALELGRDDFDMMRLEIRQRIRPDRDALPANLFDGIECIRREVPSTVSAREAAYLALRLHCPEHFGRVSPNTRKKYDELALTKCGRISPDPVSVYRGRHADLREWSMMLMSADQAMSVPRARVYEKCEAPQDAPPERFSEDGKSSSESIPPSRETALTTSANV